MRFKRGKRTASTITWWQRNENGVKRCLLFYGIHHLVMGINPHDRQRESRDNEHMRTVPRWLGDSSNPYACGCSNISLHQPILGKRVIVIPAISLVYDNCRRGQLWFLAGIQRVQYKLNHEKKCIMRDVLVQWRSLYHIPYSFYYSYVMCQSTCLRGATQFFLLYILICAKYHFFVLSKKMREQKNGIYTYPHQTTISGCDLTSSLVWVESSNGLGII